MFRVLKKGFVPHDHICTNNQKAEEIRKQVILYSANISNQIYETGTTMIDLENGMTDVQITALAEIVITELIYYDEIEKIGHFVASKLVENGEPATELNIVSSKIHQKIQNVLIQLEMPNSQVILGSAGYKNSNNESIQRYYYGLLVHSPFVLFGKGRITDINEILDELCHIAKLSSTLMDLCVMSTADTPLFVSIQIDPVDSIFGNYGWKKESQVPAATNK
jgi:hypothetical protein